MTETQIALDLFKALMARPDVLPHLLVDDGQAIAFAVKAARHLVQEVTRTAPLPDGATE